MHEKMGRQAIREFVRGMVVQERMKLDGMMRALRKIRPGTQSPEPTIVGNGTRSPAPVQEVTPEAVEMGERGHRGEAG